MKVTTRVVEEDHGEYDGLFEAVAAVTSQMRDAAVLGDAISVSGSVRKKAVKGGTVYVPKTRYTLPDANDEEMA